MATIRRGCTAMPRYFFDIREGLGFRPDRVGEEFEDLGTAKGHAVDLTGKIAKVHGEGNALKSSISQAQQAMNELKSQLASPSFK